jgi:hypothetical protein
MRASFLHSFNPSIHQSFSPSVLRKKKPNARIKKSLPKTQQFFQITVSISPLLYPCFRYLSDTHLIPFCNPTLQKGIRWVSDGYQMMAINKRSVRDVTHPNQTKIKGCNLDY